MLTFFSKILVAYDGSELAEKALKTALKLAMQDKHIELHIVFVVKPMPRLDKMEVETRRVWDLRKVRAQRMLEDVKASVEGMGNQVIVSALEGQPGTKLVEYAAHTGIDLIVMGCRGLSGLKELFLGSVSHYVVQHSRVPAFIVK
ncbi:hypothetical protein SD70_05995 [Gordoniibacillus kamchatkensis]|uniref:UspA domain-containing protein n=1 Tax=Gordoniibacillus kamchatkensis TaxID=1590651 RepID=A0ABR5AKY2_9BACL|nr:universal stress protein [Paenibacillus sp. VKM B-2647]KIL41696.1 hypothetical protein SD70_05995 [Paenibacillus sp. VKM B-2647]